MSDATKEFRDGKGTRYNYGGVWGNRIEWSDEYESNQAIQRVVGWQPHIPDKGDWLLCPMQSGKTAVFRFVKVELCGDPSDMFFADVETIGYKEYL